MGACASGAQDAHGFASAMQHGYMPAVDTLTYQGVFNEHLFQVGEQEKERAVATQCFPIINGGNRWLAVFLKSMFDGKPRSTTPIDLSVVIDISGSMSGGMTGGDNKEDGNCLEHAKRAVEWLVREMLRKDDGIAVSTFNHDGHLVQPLTRRGDMDCDAFLHSVQALHTNGGTQLRAGMSIGREQFGTDLSEPRHRRILFLTDMGEMNADELGSLIEQNANDGVYVSIVAMGAEFNARLTETVTKNRGSNYFCATNNAQLRECLIDDFAFNMFPAAFDIDVSVCSGSLEVAGVYGTPFDTKEVDDLVRRWTPKSNAYYKPFLRHGASRLLLYSHSIRRPLPVGVIGNIVDYLEPPVTSVTEVNTMFPSRIDSTGAMKGGLILIRLHPRSAAGIEQPVQVKVTYTDAMGKAFTQFENVVMPAGPQESMDPEYGAALSKALLLQHYAEVCLEHMKMGSRECRANPMEEAEALAARRAAQLGLLTDFNNFRCSVESDFKEDDKMQKVVENYDDFVKIFCKPLYEEDKRLAVQGDEANPPASSSDT